MTTVQKRGDSNDNARVGTDVPNPGDPGKPQDTDKGAPNQSHMGAEDGQVKPTKPATQELADLTDKKGPAKDSKAGDYSPEDELTPG